jgi:toxin ParE1/3/4
MASYFLTKKAVADLSDIWNYTYNVWSENQANQYYTQLIRSFDALVQNPSLGKSYREIDRSISGLKVGKHIVFYRVVPSADIEVIRILHQGMDLKTRMQE